MTGSRAFARLLFGLACLLVPARAWSDPVAPCKEAIFQVLSPTSGYLTCDRGLRIITTSNAAIFDTASQDNDPTAAATEIEHGIVAIPLAGTHASAITWQKPLTSGHSYVLRILSADLAVQGTNKPADEWDNLLATFSTKGKAQFAPFGDESNRLFHLVSDVALLPCASNKQVPVLIENRNGSDVAHAATMQPASTIGPGGSDQPTGRCLPVRSDGNAPILDPARLGSAVITLSRGAFQQEKVKLKLSGIYDIFGQAVSIPSAAVAVGTVPADKDSSTYYLKLAHEAGPDEKPAYSIDAKLAPIFDRFAWGDFEPTVSATVDVGFGKTDSTNTISLGAGLTRLFLTKKGTSSDRDTRPTDITAVRVTTLLNVEADKTFSEKHNLVAQPVGRFYFPFLDHSKARRARGQYVDSWSRATSAERANLDADEFTARWGFSGQLSLAAELGGALGQPVVETDDKTSSVTVPRHGIARALPQATATVEVFRVSVSISAAPRYLFAPETVGQIKSVMDATGAQVDQAQLVEFKRWQTHVETSVTIGLDRSGHIGFTAAYKRGPEPPEFKKINTVQSGLTLKY